MLPLLLSLACHAPADTADFGPALPSLERVGDVAVLRVAGTAYEMGYAQGELLHAELAEGAAWITDSELVVLEGLAEFYGLLDQARAESYPEVVEECQGIVDAFGDEEAWSLDRCLLLAYGDVAIERVSQSLGCTQLVAAGPASADGEVVHARNLDWTEIGFIIDHPTLIVRHPDDGLPWVAFGFPGNVSPYNGMNAAGLAFASNEAYGTAEVLDHGYAHTQMARFALEHFETLAEVRDYLDAQIHASAEILTFSDGHARDAAVFELAVDAQAVRPLSADGVVYATNHFVDPATAAVHQEPSSGSHARYLRLQQLAEPDGADSLYGQLDLATGVRVLRDTYNPVQDVTYPPEQFDDGDTIANNGAIQSLVMLPTSGRIYVASGPVPVPQGGFTGFSLPWLFGEAEANDIDPAEVP
jgi:hypothetical protein